MKIRPRNYSQIIKALTGVKFTPTNANGANWRQLVFNHYRLHLLDLLLNYGEQNDFGYWLNDMQSRHALLYNAANASGNWQDVAYSNEDVGKYQHDYKGDQRFGTYNPKTGYNTDFNQLGIVKAQEQNRYDISGPKRTSGDYGNHDFRVDNLYSAITDDRRLLGRKGDWDETSDEFKTWQNDLNSRGWEMYLDDTDNYYKLRRLPSNNPNNPNNPEGGIPIQHQEGGYGFDWNKLKTVGSKVLNNPNLLGLGRLAGNLYNNGRVYDEQIKAYKPDLINPYTTHRQVVGDEATKQAYYKRAAQGQTKAGRTITSDADRQLAYQMEAKRVGDELREKGDLADNAEIRRTSDESNQHQWANTQRATEVANRNREAINRNNHAIQLLKALKRAALWSSVDNFLQGLEYEKRKKNAEALAIRDEIFAVQQRQELLDDPEVVNATNNLLTLVTKNTDKTTGIININDEVKEAKKNLERARLNATRRLLESKEEYFRTRMKEGGKVTKKSKYKDDLLYKSVLDVVKHFQVMSKLSSDALNRKPVKIEKLAPHPKGSTRRYLLGGVAPFTIFKPVALGGETTTSTETSTSSTRATSSEDKTKQDLTKELFKSLQAEGLPSDVNLVYSLLRGLFQQQELFGNDLSSDEIQSMYIQQMLNLNLIKFNKAQFDKVAEIVRNKDAGDEMAIDLYGRVAVLDGKSGEISFVDPKKGKIDPSKSRILTNNDLLQLRAFSPLAAFDKGNILYTVSNATSMSEIAKYLKAQLPSLGNTNLEIKGFTKAESLQIIKGIELLKNAPDGDYRYSIRTKDLVNQAKMAINYLKTILPKNMKTLLDIKADLGHLSSDELIASLVGSRVNNTIEIGVEIPKEGKDSSSEGSSSGSGDSGKITPSVALTMGLGEKETITISDKTSDALKVNVVSLPLLDASNHPMANATLKQVGDGVYSGQFDLGQATMGGIKISTNGINEILIDRGRIYSAELPIDEQAYKNTGVIKPNLSFLKNIEKADQQIREAGITDRNNLDANKILIINRIYLQNNLPIIYNIGGDGKPVLTSQYRRFAMLHASAPENVFEEDPVFNDGVIEASEDDRSRFESMMKDVTNNNKYSLDNGISIPLVGRVSGTNLYKGIIYMPMTNSKISALASTGFKDKPTVYNLIEAADLQAQFIRDKGLLIQGSINNLQ